MFELTHLSQLPDTGHKLNVYKVFRSRLGRSNFLCTFKLPPMSSGKALDPFTIF